MHLLSKTNILLASIFILGFFLRFYHYPQFPVAGETMDEYAWTFLGSSLIQTGEPVSWSHFKEYQNFEVFHFQQADFKMVKPVMDHPPLFSFLPGTFHLIKSEVWRATPSISAIRLPMIFLGTLNLFLFYLVAKNYFKGKYLYLAVTLYASIPSFVFASRLVVAENLLVTWMLITLILLNQKLTKTFYYLLFLISIFAVLTKVSGIIIPLIIFVFGLKDRNFSLVICSTMGAAAGWIIFMGYGYVYDWQLFTSLIFAQSSRDIGLATLTNRLFLHPVAIEKFMVDGWLTFSVVALLSLFFKKEKKWQLLQISTMIILGFIALFVGENTIHGWYDFLLFPIYSICIVQLIKVIFKNENYLLFGFIWLMILPIFRELFTHLKIDYLPFVRPVIIVSAVPFIVNLASRKWSRRFAWLLVLLLIIVNILVVINYDHVVYWENDVFFNPIRVN